MRGSGGDGSENQGSQGSELHCGCERCDEEDVTLEEAVRVNSDEVGRPCASSIYTVGSYSHKVDSNQVRLIQRLLRVSAVDESSSYSFLDAHCQQNEETDIQLDGGEPLILGPPTSRRIVSPVACNPQ
jgi:hypothetical protein